MLSKFLDPKNDVAFKKIFGTEKNKEILIHFLNDMLAFPGKHGPIREVTFLKTSQDPETAAQKTSLVDILCRDEQGNNYIVEMQVARDKGFAKRAQYYASKVYTSQMQAGQKYHDLKQVIFLAIVDFTMFPKKKKYKCDHKILDTETYEHDLKDFSFTFLELPKFNKKLDELSNLVEKWTYFFKHAPETREADLKKLIGDDPIIEKAYVELNRFNWKDDELLTYDEADMQEKVYYGALEQKFDEGFEKCEEKIIEGLLKQGVEDSVICAAANIPVEKLRLLRERSQTKKQTVK